MHELSNGELADLEKFRLTTSQTSSSLSIQLDQLYDKQQLIEYLQKAGSRMNTNNNLVSASMLTKRYGFFAALNLYAITMWDKALNVSTKNISLETVDEDPVWLPGFFFKDLSVDIALDNRGSWRDEKLTLLFKENIYPLIMEISKTVKLSRLIMWENIALYIIWMYETLLKRETDQDLIEKIKNDFHYIMHEAPGEVFGPYHKNPLSKYFQINDLNEERMRKTCCLYYLTSEKGTRCKTCPTK
ncbi:(2Fe-2S)-binding protein [Metabacillus arenae]|uniref:(2Fe-2S)-binding protein n=1 Tax=Metabacillus arenae TaxID=2771434 RepID=A0A926NMZ0_9BACI|nr:(2Fe-2S)-binding protein [Metabacillus arenae]MBD1380781.1 (2Fe-2S)-binding protein [Metabacillus arenae]